VNQGKAKIPETPPSSGKFAAEETKAGVLLWLEALSKATLAISSELDLETVLQIIANNAREFANANYAAMGIVNDQGLITSFITSGISKEQREKIGEPPSGHGLLGVLIKQGKPLRVHDMSKDPRRSGFPPNHPPMISLLGVPVSVQGRVVGDLYVTDKIGSDEFSEDEEWWLTLFARQAAVAVVNAQLYKAARQARQRAETLTELTGTLNRSFKLEELFLQINRAASQLLELPASALYLLDRQRTRFELEAQVGLDEKADEKFFLPLHRSIAGKVLESGQSIFVQDTSVLEQIYFLPLQGKRLPGALLVVPIRQANRVSGVIEVYSAQPRHFSPEEISLLEAFAGQAALALDKAQLYQQHEEFLSMTAHDLRAPLTAIKLSAGLLETSLPSDLPPALKNLASNISRNSERLNNLLEDLLELTRLEQGRVQLRPEKLELGEAIAATVHTLLPLFEEKGQIFKFERLEQTQWLWADRRRFEQVLVNLLVNAHKYTPAGSLIQIKLLVASNWLTIGVQDNGPGIPLDEQQHIFDRYYRLATDEPSSGSGLGLPIARLLVELHGGQLWVESAPDKGSTFYFKLPLPSPS